MQTIWYYLWRWLRFPVAIVAALLVALFVWVAWLLSGQRYQLLLTEQLSALLGAEVQIAGSQLSFSRGLGIELDAVTVQTRRPDASPFFTADRVDVLLDFSALLYGQLLFHRIDCAHPRIRLSEQEGTIALVNRLLTGLGTHEPASQRFTAWFSPTLALRRLGLSNGEIIYTKGSSTVPLILSSTDLLLSYASRVGLTVYLRAALGQTGESGTMTVEALAPGWDMQAGLSAASWQGRLHLDNIVLHQVGHMLAAEWPHATLTFNGPYQGKWGEAVELTGDVALGDTQIGVVRIKEGKAKVHKLRWSGAGDNSLPPTWLSLLHTAGAEIQIERAHGDMGEGTLPVTLQSGTLSLQDEELTMNGLSGIYGRKSHVTEGAGTLKGLFSSRGPEMNLRVKAELDLREDLDGLLATFAKTGFPDFAQHLQKPHGRALVRLGLRSPRLPGAITYDGEIVVQQAGFYAPTWKREVTDLTGTVRVTHKSLSTETLTLKSRDSSLKMAGRFSDYLSPQWSGEGSLVADLDVADVTDLAEGITHLLPVPTKAGLTSFAQHLSQPRGRARVQLAIHLPRSSGAVTYDGEISLQQAAFRTSPWNLEVTDLVGIVRLNKESVATDTLSLKVGQGAIQVKGKIRDYLTAQRAGDLHLTFSEVQDQSLAPLFPYGLVSPQGGVLGGQIDVALLSGGEVRTAGEVALSRIVLDPLPKVLRPIEVMAGEAIWQGRSGTFIVRQGRLPGGAFTGHGQFRSLVPLDLEVTADFGDLDLESALNLDHPKEEDNTPKDEAVVVRVDLDVDRLAYKTLKTEGLRFSCYWHGRQADLTIHEVKAEGGAVQGKAVLWPDVGALFIAPQLTNVDVQRFFTAVGTPTDVLTGTMSGSGKVYMPDWHEWNSPAHWDALLSIAVADGVAQRVPILVRLWSAFSLQGLLSLQLPSLPNEGLTFSSLTGDFALGHGLVVPKNLSLNSSAVQLNAQGEIGLAQRTVDLKVELIPLHGITSSVAKVPLAGELLARGADLLTTVSFHVYGPYHDPTVTPLLVNTGKR